MEEMASPTTWTLQGFDPLADTVDVGEDRTLFEEATKRIVQNILKSYTGYFDVFSELLQNALDAIDSARRLDASKVGKLWIDIDIASGRMSVTDNGMGMNERELRYCFRPSVSFKNRKESRGHKGVGATFLAYGFTNIQVTTKKLNASGPAISVQLANGRAWAEDSSGTHSRPKLEIVDTNAPELAGESSGTRVDIIVGKGQRPDLTWWGAQSAEQWLKLLCMRTPLGGIYLAGATPPKIVVRLRVTASSGTTSESVSERTQYLYPHEMEEVLPRVKDLGEVQSTVKKIDGDPMRLPADFKNLSAIYETWDFNGLLTSGEWEKIFEEEEQRLIRYHAISVYGCFVSSAKSWTQYQEEYLKVRRSPPLMRGGMQIASDFMVQGDLGVIPLTSTIGYQANTHVIIHFRDGNPDMGRKVFQPEVKAIAEKISRHVVNIFKRYLHLMREDTGAPTNQESAELWHWQQDLIEHRKNAGLNFTINDRSIAYVSSPQCEQDVVAVFHELVGMNVFKGYRFLATSEIKKYDSSFMTLFDSPAYTYNKNSNALGVSTKNLSNRESKPYVLEFKFDLDGLIGDFEKEEKFLADIDLVVCWKISDAYKSKHRIISLLIGEEGSYRAFFGSTHALYSNTERRFEIICIEDLLSYMRDKDTIVALHSQKYS